MSEPNMERVVGRMEAQIVALEQQVANMQRQLADVHAVVMRAQGSWKAIVGAAGFSAAVTGVLIKIGTALGILR